MTRPLPKTPPPSGSPSVICRSPDPCVGADGYCDAITLLILLGPIVAIIAVCIAAWLGVLK